MWDDSNPDMWRIRRAQGGYIVVSLDDNNDEDESVSFREHICLTPEEACLSLRRYLDQDVANFSPDDDDLEAAIGARVQKDPTKG